MDWLPITLVCAFALASSDAATKAWLQNYSARELALVRLSITGLLISPLLFITPVPLPPIEFWLWLAALLPLEILAMLLYMRSIRDYPLSLTVPYLAFTPVFVLATGYLLLGETVSGSGLLGVILVFAGAWLLNLEHASWSDIRSWWLPLKAIGYNKGSLMMLGVAGLYSLTSVMGKGAMQYMKPEHFGPFYFAALGITTAVMVGMHKPRLLRSIWRRPLPVLLVATLSGLMVVTHFIALQKVEVAYMIALKRTSLLFGILYGALLFREHRPGINLFAGSVMLAGVALILI